MNDKDEKLARALLYALLAFFAMVGFLILFRALGYAVTADTAYLSAVFVALLIFALLSDRLAEFSFGGFSAKFQAAAKAAVAGVDLEAAGLTLHRYEKSAVMELPRLTRTIRNMDTVAIEIGLVPNSSYPLFSTDGLFEYVRAFSAVAANPFVMIVDDKGEFVAAAEAGRIAALHPYSAHPELAGNADNIQLESLVNLANANNAPELRKLPFLQTNKAKVGISNIDALKKMQAANADFLVLVDDKDHPVKVATRQRIVEHLLLALAT